MKKISLIENTYPVKLSCRNEEGIEASSLDKQKLEKMYLYQIWPIRALPDVLQAKRKTLMIQRKQECVNLFDKNTDISSKCSSLINMEYTSSTPLM